jgi:hypothetical protein
MADTHSIACTALVALLVSAGMLRGASAAVPLEPYDPGAYGVPLDDAPGNKPPNTLLAPPNQPGPARDANAPDPGATGKLNVTMPEVTFGNLLTQLRTPPPAADSSNQYSTPDTTSSYSTSAPTDPTQQDTVPSYKDP